MLTPHSIDGLNTSSIGLLDLRRRLAIIPQDAALFEGTIRDNLDPRHVHDDTELWSVLAHARLQEHVAGMEGQLDAVVHEGGKCTNGDPALACEARPLTVVPSVTRIEPQSGSTSASVIGASTSDPQQHLGAGRGDCRG